MLQNGYQIKITQPNILILKECFTIDEVNLDINYYHNYPLIIFNYLEKTTNPYFLFMSLDKKKCEYKMNGLNIKITTSL